MSIFRRRKLRAAYAARDAADQALCEAVWRRNTQDLKRRHDAMYRATHAALALEVK